MSEESIAVDRNRQGSTGIEKTPTGRHVRAARYEAQIIAGPAPEIHIRREGWLETWSPAANLSDEFRRTIVVPRSLGIFPETPYPPEGPIADRVAEIFAPPMLCLAFGAHGRCQ